MAVETRPNPVPASGEVVLSMGYVGLCGTDLHIVEGSHPRAAFPLVLGHELLGTALSGQYEGRLVVVDPLISCGSCSACQLGESHVCEQLRLIGIDRDGGLAERLAVDARRLHVVPEGLSPEMAALAEPLAVAVHAMRRSAVQVGDGVVVLGAGPIGLLLAACARQAGARQVMVLEPASGRRQLASEMGLQVIDPQAPVEDLRARTHGWLADVAFDAAAAPPVAALLTQMVRPGGQVMLVGAYSRPAEVDLQAAVFRELTMRGSRVYQPRDIDTALSLLATGNLGLAGLVSDIVLLEETASAIDRLARGDAMKVLVDCKGPR
ncbi:MAG: alcohol dehydrogenase catalytic domain-containing protein [Chloroflexota bacterium]|nr:alcohol dehydrogenase catalytic domain-containing protein [Chloroflexota bacterium]